MKSFSNFLFETFKIKVRSTGKKRRKLSCPQGYQPNEAGTACVPITGAQKHNMKVGARHAALDKKAQGPALQKRTNRKTKKAMRFRKSFGLT